MTEQERIAKIEQSIAGLESILTELKSELKEVKQTSSETVPEITPVQVTPSVPETVTPVQITTPIASPVPETKAATKKKSSGLEENLGGKVMGIVAAVLVFVGLFLFGSLMYERLGDPARIVSLYLISFLILGAGLFFERKHRSWFTTSLIGCGFGAVYISLFVTCLYFNLYSVEVLYLLLILWLVSIGLYVFRKQSYVVASLGQAGIAFSIIFGCIGIASKGQFTFLCLYFTILSFLYLWLVLWRFLPTSKEKPYSWVSLVAAALNLVQLLVLSASHDFYSRYRSNMFGEGSPLIAALLCIYTFALPFFFLLRNRRLAGLPLFPWKKTERRITDTNFPIYNSDYGVSTGLGIYFGLRVTVYMIAVLTSFDSIEGYVISCALLLLAVIAVLAGFPLRLAALRIYGLFLAMIAVIKLLMIDVEHDNSMETVLCFLGAGLLCFAINFIYNHVKKKFKNDTNRL